MALITQLIAGHTLEVSLCIIYAVRHFASFPSFQLQKTWRSLCNTKVLQQHSVGTSDQGLSVYRALCLTGHQSSANRLLEFHAQYQVVKTLAVHCHSDVCNAAVGILQGVERSRSVYGIMPQW
jgi:hypothetical protein